MHTDTEWVGIVSVYATAFIMLSSSAHIMPFRIEDTHHSRRRYHSRGYPDTMAAARYSAFIFLQSFAFLQTMGHWYFYDIGVLCYTFWYISVASTYITNCSHLFRFGNFRVPSQLRPVPTLYFIVTRRLRNMYSRTVIYTFSTVVRIPFPKMYRNSVVTSSDNN